MPWNFMTPGSQTKFHGIKCIYLIYIYLLLLYYYIIIISYYYI